MGITDIDPQAQKAIRVVYPTPGGPWWILGNILLGVDGHIKGSFNPEAMRKIDGLDTEHFVLIREPNAAEDVPKFQKQPEIKVSDLDINTRRRLRNLEEGLEVKPNPRAEAWWQAAAMVSSLDADLTPTTFDDKLGAIREIAEWILGADEGEKSNDDLPRLPVRDSVLIEHAVCGDSLRIKTLEDGWDVQYAGGDGGDMYQGFTAPVVRFADMTVTVDP